MMQAQGSTCSLVTEDHSVHYRIDGQGRKRYLATNPDLATARNWNTAVDRLAVALDKPGPQRIQPIYPSLYRGSKRALAIGLACVLSVAMAALVTLAYLGLKSAGIAP